MPIQLIIFITKTKIFASEINSIGKAESISIKGNSEIRCEGRESIEELIECLYDAYNIDDFADDNFDIVIVEAGADREINNCLDEKCKGAAKLNIISVEKLLPVIVSNKNLVMSGEEITVTFADMFYKIICDESGIIKIGKARKNEEAVPLSVNDFACLYHFAANGITSVVDETKLDEAREEIAALQRKLSSYETLQNMVANNKKEFARLNQTITKLQEELKIAKGPTDNEVFKKRLEIVKKYEKQIVVSPYGFFYTKGSIPKKRLDDALALINNEDTKINRERVIAFYCGSNRNDATNLLVLTNDTLYFDKGFTYPKDEDVVSDCFSFESILRMEQREISVPFLGAKLTDAVVFFLQNKTDITIGDKSESCAWGLKVDVLMNMLKELSEISETE